MVNTFDKLFTINGKNGKSIIETPLFFKYKKRFKKYKGLKVDTIIWAFNLKRL